jgi:integrase
MHRTLGRARKQAIGITMLTLEKMSAAASDNLRRKRDEALLLLGYDSLCRRTELLSLKIEDIVHDDRGIPTLIRLRKSKTDQEAVGKVIRITPKTPGAIKNWINVAKISEGFLFGGVKNNGGSI